MSNIFDYKSHNLTASQNLDLIRSICIEKRFGRSMKLVTGKALKRKLLVKKILNGEYVPTKKAKRLMQYIY
jgi:hypothetical protein